MSSSMTTMEDPSGSSIRRVVLHFSDGESRIIEVAEGQEILAAAKARGVNLASQCTVGTCATCISQLLVGDAQPKPDVVTVLTSEEASRGQRLLCQTLAHSDAEFDMGYPSSLLLANPPVFFNAKIGRITRLAESVAEIEVKVPKTMRLKFTAGQYCRIRVPGTDDWRSYSMASGEHEPNKLTFLIRILPKGTMSDYLRDRAKAGDVLEIEGPLGSFVLEPTQRPHLLVAGGTGLAPMLSMIDRLRLLRPAPPIQLVFGCVKEADLFHLDELRARASFTPTLQVRISLEQDSTIPGVLKGNPVTVLSQTDAPEGTIAYLCGPPGMIAAAEQAMAGFGLSLSDVRSEQFLPS
jgi:ferredoxin-NADP reductase/ferredoxin